MSDPSVQRAVFWLDDGTGRGRVPVTCGWWIYTASRRYWRPWRPRWARNRTLG